MARLLVCTQDCIESQAIQKYAQYIYDLQGDQFSDLKLVTLEVALSIKQTAIDLDLFIFGKPKQSVLGRLLAGNPCCKAVSQAPFSVLVVGQPHWPIQNILLIVRVEETDEAAVDWAGRLARASGANVSVLPILPPFTSVYLPTSYEETTLSELLSPKTQTGRQLRLLSQRLALWQIESILRFRQGEPWWQIHGEVKEGNYDLIVIGAEPYGSWRRLLIGELVGPMLGWMNRPLLVARPTQSPKDNKSEANNRIPAGSIYGNLLCF